MSKQKVYRAGIIPYYIEEGSINMLFMIPSKNDGKFGGNSPQLIKGVREEGETPLEAAIREGQEESGLFPPNIKGDPHHLGKFLGRTDVFVAEIKDNNMFGDPTTPHEVDHTKWMTLDEFQSQGRDLHKPVVKAAVRWIKNKQRNDKIIDEVFSKPIKTHPESEFNEVIEKQLTSVNFVPNVNGECKNTDNYYINSWMWYKHWLTEAPQLISDTDFEIDNQQENTEKAKEILNDSDFKVIQNIGETVIVSNFTDSEAGGTLAAIDNSIPLVLFIVKFEIEEHPPIPFPVVIQFVIWKGTDNKVEHMPTEMFDVLLKLTGGILTDAWHTSAGQKFWLSQVNRSFENPDKFVYYVNLSTGTIKELKQPYDVRKYPTLWSSDQASTTERILITTKPLSLKEEFLVLQATLMDEAVILSEMPHIRLKSGTIDLQLEMQSGLSKEEFIEYIQDLLSGKPVYEKGSSRREMRVPPENAADFAKQLLDNDMFKLYILKKYDRETVHIVTQLLTNVAMYGNE